MAQPYPLRTVMPVSPGFSDLPTYSAHFHLAPTAAMDLLSVKAGAGKVVRIKQIILTNLGQQTTAGIVDLQFGFASNVGSGGADHGAPHNYGAADGDPASTSTARVGDTTVAPNFVSVGHLEVFVPAAKAQQTPFDFQFHDGHKPPTIKGDHATLNTFVLRHAGAAGAADMTGFIEWTEEVL